MTRAAIALLTAFALSPRVALAQASLTAALDSIARAALQPGRVAGLTVAVVRGTDTLLHKSYGVADISTGSAIPRDAIYEIGSVTKQFTAVAILKLVGEGRLRLDDEITRVLPGYDDHGQHVTIRHLLDHTSGIPAYTAMDGFSRIEAKPGSRDSLIKEIAKAKPDFAPRERMTYSNSGYFLLGKIIELVSGESYAGYVAKHLFRPAGMTSSSYCDRTRATPRMIPGHSVSSDRLVKAKHIDHTWPYAAGSLCSTATDLLRWTRALHTGKILGPKQYAEWLRPDTIRTGYRLRYAKGIAVDSILGRRVARHGGDITGYSTEVDHYPDDSLTVVVLTNTFGPVRPATVATALAARIFGPDQSGRATRGVAADYVGKYTAEGDAPSIEIKATRDGGLTVKVDRGDDLQLTWVGPDMLVRNRTRFTFTRTGGRVTGVVYDPVYAAYPLRKR